MNKLKIVIFGLSITSSWGNGHATTFRSLVKALAERGHKITFYEKDVPWYANQRDLANPPFCETRLYKTVEELKPFEQSLAEADLVILGSYVADAARLTDIITRLGPRCLAFYDIDTPVTLAKLEAGDYEYLTPHMVPQFDLYLSFTGGPTLERLEQLGAQRARPLYCSVDTDLYHPERHTAPPVYELGYLGTYSTDRQPTVEELLIKPALQAPGKRFCVAGAQYPTELSWPANVQHIEHIPPQEHRQFYNDQRFTLNVTRADMIQAGYSPSVRLFEAGACGTPIISDYWQGLESFFELGTELLVARNSDEMLQCLETPEDERQAMGRRLREKVLSAHTSEHRALQLERYWHEVCTPATA